MSLSGYWPSGYWVTGYWPEGYWPETTVTDVSMDVRIQNALARLLRALAVFDDGDVTVGGDFRVLGRRTGEQAVIVPGALQGMRAGDWAQVRVVWLHQVELWTDFRGDDLATLVALRQAVHDQLAAYPTLNHLSRVADARVDGCSEVLWMYGKGAGPDSQPVKAGYRLTVRTVEERVYSSSGEFA